MFLAAYSTLDQTPLHARRRDRMMLRALHGSRFDPLMHLRIMQQVHRHVSSWECDLLAPRPISCQGPGGDLFFAMKHYWLYMCAWARYPRAYTLLRH